MHEKAPLFEAKAGCDFGKAYSFGVRYRRHGNITQFRTTAEKEWDLGITERIAENTSINVKATVNLFKK